MTTAIANMRDDDLPPSVPFTLSFVGLVGGLLALAMGLMRALELAPLMQFTAITVVLCCALPLPNCTCFQIQRGR